jgi:hypothetical protein
VERWGDLLVRRTHGGAIAESARMEQH